MKFCHKCGSRLLPKAKFCHRCGAPLLHREEPLLYRSSIAEAYYETVLKPIAEERLEEKIRHRESPTKPFEK